MNWWKFYFSRPFNFTNGWSIRKISWLQNFLTKHIQNVKLQS